MKRFASLLLVVLLLCGVASAETLSLSGTVEAGVTLPVIAPIGGTVESLNMEAGMRVNAGDVLLTFATEKIYASEDGTVTGVFAEPGDNAETVAGRYGAVLYIEGTTLYSVSASVNNAYSAAENTFVHVGETVYLQCRSNNNRQGVGLITAVEGSSYTVTVTEGSFITGDSVSIFRDAAFTDKLRIGRGSVSRISPTAVTGSGAVVRIAVKDGDTVHRGDLLMETLSGTFAAYQMTGTEITASEAGVITSISATLGSSVGQGETVAQIAPLSGMRIEAAVSADDRKELQVGEKVMIELVTDESKTYEGVVRAISEIPEEGAEETTYKAIIDFTPDEHVVFGMAVVITTEEADAPAAEAEPEEAVEQEEAAAPADGE